MKLMQKVVPHLWFDTQAYEAATWYVSLFEDSKIIRTHTLHDTPSGEVESVDFQLAGVKFQAISAGPFFTFNPSISFMVSCDTSDEVDNLYKELIQEGTALMEVGEYPFSKRFAWVQDKYGLSWQLTFEESSQEIQKIRPCLLFAEKACGKAKEALDYYTTVFEQSEKQAVTLYHSGEAADSRAVVKYGEFHYNQEQFILMDHVLGGGFTFNEAFSLMIMCETQSEIDYYWEKFSHVPESEECGWVKDQFGVSWQIVPRRLNELLDESTEEESNQITQAMLKMKKLNIEKLERAKQTTVDET
jgi:predicted 3-demethylubiquinone-9 3-methyltransferase (glyoxalase superfamily)